MTDPQPVRKARQRVAVFWLSTVIYLAVVTALLITLHDVLGVIFIAVMACSWFFLRWPQAKPHFAVLREARRKKELSSST